MFEKPMFILDIANNHMGDVKKGLEIINQHHEVIKKYKEQFSFVFKFQYRQLDSFIYNAYKDSDHKYVKRFQETKLSQLDYLTLKNRIEELGHYTAVTPFDNDSVNIIKEQNFDIIKIASASMCDWSLFEEIVKLDKPIIMSTAGTTLKDIDKAVMFFTNRNKDLKIMHCVGEYPTLYNRLNLNQIDLLKNLYSNIEVGFSTHEIPENYDAIQIAVSKGCKIFERHIDTECDTINKYSSTPKHIKEWICSAIYALKSCGVENQRHEISVKEISDLTQFKRGIFANKDIEKGQKITDEDIYYAWPTEGSQILACEYSKYDEMEAITSIKKDEYLSIISNVKINNNEKVYLGIIKDLIMILNKGNIHLPENYDIYLSHHYGLDKFREQGAAIIECILEGQYAKKLLVMLPGQKHPSHKHIKKKETFQLLYGDFKVYLEIENSTEVFNLKIGDNCTVESGIFHKFSTENGCVFEEVSTASLPNDSIYEDQTIMDNYNNRKTILKANRDFLNNK